MTLAAGDPGFDGGPVMQQLLPDPTLEKTPFISELSMLCKESQRQPKQTEKYPRLQSKPGSWVALRYLENGHVTLLDAAPNNQKPKKGGTVFVYGTTDPKPEEKLVDVLRWTKNGNGGDKRGKLLAANDFDDGRCAQVNPSTLSSSRMAATADSDNAEIPCETNVHLPKNLTVGQPYTLYWVWQWNTEAGKFPGLPIGKDEYYTTCMDIDMVDVVKADVAKTNMYPVPQQDRLETAVSDWKHRKALYTDAIKAEVGPYFSGGSTTSGAPPPTGIPSASSVTQTTLATSMVLPSNNGSDGGSIPTLTKRPGRPKPSNKPSSGTSDEAEVTVTDIVYITVTAPSITGTVTARATGAMRRLRA